MAACITGLLHAWRTGLVSTYYLPIAVLCCVCNQVRLTWDALHDMTWKWQRAMPWLRPISAAYPVQSVFRLEFWEEAVEPPVHEATVTQGNVRWRCVALQREWAFADWAYLSFQALLWKLHSFRWYFHILFHGMSSPKFPLTLGISWFERFPDQEAYSDAVQNASQNRWSSQIWLQVSASDLLASLVLCMHDGQALCPHPTCLS